MGILDLIVRKPKTLYIGISNYKNKEGAEAFKRFRTLCFILQPNYNLFNRSIENGWLDLLRDFGVGIICLSPLVQRMLTNKYITGLPKDSRAIKDSPFLNANQVIEKLPKIKELHKIAENRNQSLAQMAISWILKDARITSVLIGASKTDQITDSVKAIEDTIFTEHEIIAIDTILTEY